MNEATLNAVLTSDCNGDKSQAAESHRPDDDFTRLFVDFERHEKPTRPAIGPMSHLSDEVRDPCNRRLRSDDGPLAS